MNLVLMAGLAVLAAVVLILPAIGFLRFSTAGFFFTASVAPFPILLWSSDSPHHTGITYTTSPSIATYTLSLCILLLGVLRGWRRSLWFFAYGIAVVSYLSIGLLTVWSGDEAQWAGALHWLSALVALIVGYQFGSQMTAELYRFLVGTVCLLFSINALLCVAQIVSIPLTLFPAQLATYLASDRPIGTFSHPSTPGKFVLVMLIIVLPALRSGDRMTRRMAWWCIGIAVPLVAITLARANLAAVVLAIMLWLLLDRRSWVSNPKRVLLLIAVLVLSAPVVGSTLERFSTDPGGGDRASIYNAGLRQLSSNLWMGIGPNYYAEVVGRWDQMTAAGFPLHNTFLYPVAELGLVGGVLFTLPVFAVCAIAIVDCLSGHNPSPWSKAYLVTFPGIMAIAMTGWGMLAGSILILWYFAVGLGAGGMLRRDATGRFAQNGVRSGVADQLTATAQCN